jgi:hypothetical protein
MRPAQPHTRAEIQNLTLLLPSLCHRPPPLRLGSSLLDVMSRPRPTPHRCQRRPRLTHGHPTTVDLPPPSISIVDFPSPSTSRTAPTCSATVALATAASTLSHCRLLDRLWTVGPRSPARLSNVPEPPRQACTLMARTMQELPTPARPRRSSSYGRH